MTTRCVREFEFPREDIDTYRDLLTVEIPAAGLRMATSDRPARSARYREILRPKGFEDELSAVIRADGMVWALIAPPARCGRANALGEDLDRGVLLCRPSSLRERPRMPGTTAC
jgi:hypothetical protein